MTGFIERALDSAWLWLTARICLAAVAAAGLAGAWLLLAEPRPAPAGLTAPAAPAGSAKPMEDQWKTN